MLQPIRLFWALLLLLTLGANSSAHGQLLQSVKNQQVRAMPNSKIWGKTSFEDVTLKLHFRSRVKPASLRIGRDHPNGTRFLAEFPAYSIPIPLEFPDDFAGFDEFGDLNEGYYVQVAEHDFDHDGTPEIVVAVGDGLANLVVNVVKYHAPSSSKDAERLENWSVVGSFTGQQKAQIEGDTITLPIGSQGLYKEYTWVKRKFVETN